MQTKVRVWFNRWFSVAYHYMNAIRNNPDGIAVEIYGTHPDIRHMSLQACDYAEVEPVLDDDAYVDFCVNFCKQHKIDVFIPRLKMLQIAKAIHLFDEIGTKVIVCRDVSLLEQLMDKSLFYESVREKDVMVVPDYYVVNDGEGFKHAYEKLIARGHRVCIKPTNGEGGVGFRIIDNNRDPFADLLGVSNKYVSYEEVSRILSGVGKFDDLMVMELLDGLEYSIDCLSDPEGNLLAAVPRRKAGGRLRLMENVPELIDIAKRVANTYKIPYNFNIQMKYREGVPKLLEINPRMSGGLHVTCLTGINFPYLAVKLALGERVDVQSPRYNLLASHVEMPMLMKDVSNN
ncbi:MAG: ATP-grasp domain-containing protein [Candidatus Cohnella colombiensis]|uniref:ATP-grasp domain-containing protein n=1 Tax=Candidatus Cohnella colombiensis TaxID=3121368 RepID=A0AA95JB35_9BACL|nr:MAG: ATP-grasp domain-containing protein [Cohnella sp.]